MGTATRAFACTAEEYLAFARFPRPQYEEDSINEMVTALVEFVRPLATRQGVAIGQVSAAVMILVVPTTVLAILIRRFLLRGLTLGGVKG